MSYSAPTIGPAGLTIAQYQDILTFLLTQLQSIFGSTIYLAPDSADYQDAAVRALQAADVNYALQAVYLSFSPLYAVGPSLDLVGTLIGTARMVASYSSVGVTLGGTAGTVITNGVVQDTSNNLWNLPGSVTIGLGGTVNVNATAQLPGAISADVGTVIRIATPSSGWNTVTNASAAVVGSPVESDSAYRARLLVAQAKPSLTLIAGTTAAVASVPGVTRSVVYENPASFTCSFGYCNTVGTALTLVTGYLFDSTMVGQAIVVNGVANTITAVPTSTTITLNSSAGSLTAVQFQVGPAPALGPEHSITTVVEGGSSTDIANAIYTNKGIGPFTNGTTSVVVTDPSNGGLSQTISFDVLAYTKIYVYITVHGLTGFNSAVLTQIQTDVVAYLNSLGIGQPVIYSELYGAALNARSNPDAPTFSIRSLISGKLAASTTATTASGSPNITVASGTGTANGQTVVGAGIPAGTTISSGGGTTSIVLTLNATATAAGVAVSFFPTATSDIPIDYAKAAQGLTANVVVVSV